MAASFEFSPEKLIYGGDALGHYRGQTVLVPRVLPGERLEVEPVRTAKGVLHARAKQVLVPAPEREDPPCPYFGRCGGCHYQHFNAERQTALKAEILRETLRRLGRITWDAEIPRHFANPWHYRNQAQFKVAPRGEGLVEIGFFEAESHRLFPVDACLILSPRLNAILSEFRREPWLRALGSCREIEVLSDDRDEHAQIVFRGDFELNHMERLAKNALERLPGVTSVAVERGAQLKVFGEGSLTYRVGEFQYQISPASFFQSSRFSLPELVSAVTRCDSGAVALDLFCGVGLFTLPLASHFSQIMGVEAHRGSVADLAANLRRAAIDNVRPAPQTALDFLRRWAQPEPALVVLDPPRAGAGISVLKLLVRLRPKMIHYLSCCPPTLARDLGYLVQNGYRLISLELFDLFPQTYHVESLAKLSAIDT